MRRRGIGRRPSLVGTAARTAVVAGTASAVVNSSHQKAAAKADMAAKAQAFDEAQQQAAVQTAVDQAVAQATAATAPAASPPPPPPAPPAGGVVEQLQQLATLREQGVLDDAEFATAKAKLLGH